MVESPDKKTEQPKSPKESFFRLAQLLLAGIGILSALCYVLGRIYLEAYYYYLGITPQVLRFSPEDYMFSSYSLILMCLFVSCWIFIYWRAAQSGKQLFPSFPLSGTSSKSMIIWLLFGSGLILFGSGLILVMIFYTRTIVVYPGLIGMSLGVAIGTLTNLGLWLLDFGLWLFGKVKKKVENGAEEGEEERSKKRAKRFNYGGLFIIVLILIACFPSITASIAKIKAESDVERFSRAVLICDDVLPQELQSSQNPKESTEVRVITTNNDMMYVISQDSASKNGWQIYAFPQDSIKQIIYLHKK